MKREEGSGVMGRFGLGVFSKLMGILGLLVCFFFAFEGAAFAQDGGAVLGLGGLGSPIVSGMLIVLIVGGLYLEVQAPGAVIPMVIATVAALVFFIPLYSMGLVQGLDLGLFLVGLLLLLIEIFAIPGFGITGVLGLLGIFTGLTLSLVDNELLFAWQAGAHHGSDYGGGIHYRGFDRRDSVGWGPHSIAQSPGIGVAEKFKGGRGIRRGRGPELGTARATRSSRHGATAWRQGASTRKALRCCGTRPIGRTGHAGESGGYGHGNAQGRACGAELLG